MERKRGRERSYTHRSCARGGRPWTRSGSYGPCSPARGPRPCRRRRRRRREVRLLCCAGRWKASGARGRQGGRSVVRGTFRLSLDSRSGTATSCFRWAADERNGLVGELGVDSRRKGGGGEEEEGRARWGGVLLGLLFPGIFFFRGKQVLAAVRSQSDVPKSGMHQNRVCRMIPVP